MVTKAPLVDTPRNQRHIAVTLQTMEMPRGSQCNRSVCFRVLNTGFVARGLAGKCPPLSSYFINYEITINYKLTL